MPSVMPVELLVAGFCFLLNISVPKTPCYTLPVPGLFSGDSNPFYVIPESTHAEGIHDKTFLALHSLE